MAEKTVKIILDTNWYISASVSRKSRRSFYEILTNPNLTIVYSKELLHEYRSVIGRPNFRKIISETQVLRFLSLIVPRIKET